MNFCSAGYDRIVVRPNGNISRCYSRSEVISTIYNFDYNQLNPKTCNQINCGLCDQRNNTIKPNIDQIIRRKFDIQLVITEQCFHQCHYCTHSDRAQKYNKPISVIPMNHFVQFLNKIDSSNVIIIGGEPTLRDDISELFVIQKHNFIMFSAWLYTKKIQQIIDSTNETETKLYLKVTMHPYAKDFNLERFWNNIELTLNQSKNIKIIGIYLLNYKIRNIIIDVKNKCKELGIPFKLKPVDLSVVSERYDYSNQEIFNKL